MNWKHFKSIEKAIDHLLWRTFQQRASKTKYVVVYGPEEDFVVMARSDAIAHELTIVEGLEATYKNMSYRHIKLIRIDEDPPSHLERISSLFSSSTAEVLRFILESQIPIDKLIRYELAIRGYDQDGKWVGFEKAKEIWLT